MGKCQWFEVESMAKRQTAGLDEGNSDLEVVMNLVKQQLGGLYQIFCLRNMTPVGAGYPMARPRFYILGIRKPACYTESHAMDALHSFLQETGSLPVDPYPSFLKMDPPGFSWSRLHELPNADELDKLKRCGCSLNPYGICEIHPCKCKSCEKQKKLASAQESGTVTVPDSAPACTWRAKAADFMKKVMPELKVSHEEGKLTYVEYLEMHGLQGPESARERHLLNVVARHPKVSPLEHSLAVTDVSQGIDRLTLFTNGIVPTLATNSRPWSMRHARYLTVGELIALCGLPPSTNMTGQTETAARFMLGNCMHAADVGIATSAALGLAMGLFP